MPKNEHTACLDEIVFTGFSDASLNLADAVKYASNKKGSVLQSARESAAARIEAINKEYNNKAQITRTAAIYFVTDKKVYIAFDDSFVRKKNICYLLAKNGYSDNNVFMNDKVLRAALRRAEKAGRIEESSRGPLELSTNAADENYFGNNKLVKAVLCEVAEPYTRFLNEEGHNKGYVWMPKEALMLYDKYAKVIPVSLGGREFRSIASISADWPFKGTACVVCKS